MNGQPDALLEEPAARSSTPCLGWEEFSHELAEYFPPIELGEVTGYATKCGMGSVGPHRAHLSAMIIVFGGLLGPATDPKNSASALKAKPIILPRRNFDLKGDKFWIDYHENGSVKSYKSSLRVAEGDRYQ